MDSLLQSSEKHQKIAYQIFEAYTPPDDDLYGSDFSFYIGHDPNEDQYSHYEIFEHAMGLAVECNVKSVEVWKVQDIDYVYFFIGTEDSVTERLERILMEVTQPIIINPPVKQCDSNKTHQEILNKILEIEDDLKFLKNVLDKGGLSVGKSTKKTSKKKISKTLRRRPKNETT